MGPPRGSHVLHRLILGMHEKILFNINFLLNLIEMVSDPSSKLFGRLDDAFPELMNRHSQVSDQGPLDPLVDVLLT